MAVVMFYQVLTIMDFSKLKIKWIKLQTKFKLTLTCDIPFCCSQCNCGTNWYIADFLCLGWLSKCVLLILNYGKLHIT